MKKQKYLFRAKYFDSDQWVYGGGIWTFAEETLMICETRQGCPILKPVKKETVGQYIGIRDEKKERIFEGDIVKNVKGIELVRFEFGEFSPFNSYNIEENSYPNADKSKIIGNIFDNPELLKENQ